MKIGNVECGNIILAPMAGITDMPFRALCREQGATFSYTEMISAKALYYKNKNTLPLLQVAKGERPIAVQLFGNEPELLAQEALKLEEGPYDVFDVNMGCPVPKVVNNGEGSALMRDPEKVEQIVRAMTKVLHKPVTIKIRKGFSADQINAVEVARRAEDAGAAAIAIHGRTREEYYSGHADYDIIRQVKEAVSIPVMGSGDIYKGKDAKRMLDETGCDAVMIARGARGNPWIFREVAHFLETGEELPRPSVDTVKEMILRHARMLIDFCGENMAIRQMRKHAGYYVTGYPDASKIRREVNLCVTFSDLERTLTKWEG
ncbi:MAG: tRNA dihydrouridine synthase DusB [Lachnospiraceae bacterium]|nr:tRNA dihydrouridine synthase DusB [Lachnospiraceae bacterium]